MKKRKVKYNTNKLALNPVRKFQLFGEAIEENRMMDLWTVLNNKTEDDVPPISMMMNFFSGSLVIAMQKQLIDREQSFHIWCEIHAEHEDGRKVKLEYEIAIPERMTYSQFITGTKDEEDPIYVIESGIKTRWKGANALMDEYLHEVAGEGFKITKQPYTVTCFSAFRNLACAMEFKKIQLVTLGNGLGAA